jgi:hypothetical protein
MLKLPFKNDSMSLIECAVGWELGTHQSSCLIWDPGCQDLMSLIEFHITAVDCIWGPWSAWTNCSAGENTTRTRKRKVNTTASSGGDECSTFDSSGKEPCRNILIGVCLKMYSKTCLLVPMVCSAVGRWCLIIYQIFFFSKNLINYDNF